MHSVGRYLRSPLMEPRDARKLGEFMQQVMSMRSKLVLGVAGGKLSEGVEYTLPSPEGRRSIVGSVVIAGLPFPVPDFEFELRRKLYEERYCKSLRLPALSAHAQPRAAERGQSRQKRP